MVLLPCTKAGAYKGRATVKGGPLMGSSRVESHAQLTPMRPGAYASSLGLGVDNAR